MTLPHHPFPVQNLDGLDLRELDDGYQKLLVSKDNPLGKEAIFKCKNVSISEVFGYLFARAIEVPTSTFQVVWLLREIQMPCFLASPGHLGILIEFIASSRKIRLETIATRNSSFTVRFLTLCLFDRFEWPEILDSDEGTFVVDLERIGPFMCIDEFTKGSPLEIKDALSNREREYGASSMRTIEEVINVAKELSLLQEFKMACTVLSRCDPTAILRRIAIQPHPLSRQFSAFFLACMSGRQNELAKKFGTQSWPQVDWKKTIKYEAQ